MLSIYWQGTAIVGKETICFFVQAFHLNLLLLIRNMHGSRNFKSHYYTWPNNTMEPTTFISNQASNILSMQTYFLSIRILLKHRPSELYSRSKYFTLQTFRHGVLHDSQQDCLFSVDLLSLSSVGKLSTIWN